MLGSASRENVTQSEDPNLEDIGDMGRMMMQAPFDGISLQSIGAHLLFGGINTSMAHSVVEFILKANYTMEPGTPLTLLLNTPGGDVSAGYSIINTMQMSRLPISTVAIGEVCSMGVFVLVAGSQGQRFATRDALVMSHQFTSGMYAKQHELLAVNKLYNRLDTMSIRHFLRYTNMSEKQIRDVLLGPSDKWLTPQECLKYGLIDKIKSPWEQEDEDEEHDERDEREVA